ncbi:hypothetical protein EV182_008963, partial [Spiromyces aspiralis]
MANIDRRRIILDSEDESDEVRVDTDRSDERKYDSSDIELVGTAAATDASSLHIIDVGEDHKTKEAIAGIEAMFDDLSISKNTGTIKESVRGDQSDETGSDESEEEEEVLESGLVAFK